MDFCFTLIKLIKNPMGKTYVKKCFLKPILLQKWASTVSFICSITIVAFCLN